MSSSLGESRERIDSGSAVDSSSSLRGSLAKCNKCFASGDYDGGDEAVADVVQRLSDVAESDVVSVEALTEVLEFLSDPSSDEAAVDALSVHLPNSLIQLVHVSDECKNLVERTIDYLVTNSNPRDMLPILCEALDTQIKVSSSPSDFIILMGGLSRVIGSIRRHHFQQIKVAIPVIFKVISAISSEFDGEAETSLADFLTTVHSIALSIQSLCLSLERESREKLGALLALYIIQNMAFLSKSNLENRVNFLVRELSALLPFCGLSYLSLITGDSIESISLIICGEGEDDLDSWLQRARGGACLSVLWGYMSDDVAKAAGEEVGGVLKRLREDSMQKWKMIATMKHVFLSADYSWKIRSHGVEFVLNVMDGLSGDEQEDNFLEKSGLLPGVFASLQGLEKVMIFSMDATLRKKTFSAFKRILSEIPKVQRLDVLKAMITNGSSPDMIGLLLDLVRDEVHKEGLGPTFWSEAALELVDIVLRPPRGGPPSFPQDGVPVLSALNLYRFVLIRATAGGSRSGSLITAASLRKAYSEWLLPLRAVVAGIEAETREDGGGELTPHVQCTFNPLQLVLHRCIELVEDSMKKAK